ncbi:hypothetical protein [Flavobacterium geliluteum]|uniref:WG repeat-containing protein n=1 Tax=Flavobacterium geliluteum TaxID=2816120 RepID=A0A940XC35_9FLAO|nr:hypothetical protein [Flavobacterium geliluteum]MBP4137045.1 hypothetical protein [Flavobacterium geliluteum]
MKKIILVCLFLMSVFSNAQVVTHKNAASKPSWGPLSSEDFRYYYLPDIDIYYDTEKSEFIYDKKGKWVRVKSLPSQCKGYNLYEGYKVIITDYNGNIPYQYHQKHLVKYPKENRGKEKKIVKTKSVPSKKSVVGQNKTWEGSTKSIPATKGPLK